MNFSYEETSKIKKQTYSKKKKTKNRASIVGLRIFLTVGLILGFAAAGGLIGAYFGIIQGAPKLEPIKIIPNIYTSVIYDNNGNETDRLKGEENREYVTFDRMPQDLKNAFVAIEDERFYQHDGIDFRGMARALFLQLTGGRKEGASTITQQLIKNSVMKIQRNTIITKLQEQYLALQYEKMLLEEYKAKDLVKDYILEVYLNTIELGHNIKGVQTAAYFYFNKDVSELSLSECAVIAAITQNPSRYTPVRYPEKNKERRDTILRLMNNQGYISDAEYADALEDDVYSRISESERLTEFQNSYHSYFVDQLIQDVAADLSETRKISIAEAFNLVYNGGLQIYSTQDMEMQKIMDSSFADDSFFPARDFKIHIEYDLSVKNSVTDKTTHYHREYTVKTEAEIEPWVDSIRNELVSVNDDILAEKIIPVPQPQAAMIIMDYHNGNVKALTGGRGEKMANLLLNRATTSTRQPGSVFKILASYAPALDLGLITPSTILIDAPYTVPEFNYSPDNWYGGYRGAASVRDGIRNSMNVITVKNMMNTGIDACFDYLRNFRFTTLLYETTLVNGRYMTDKGPTACLGGLTNGVTQIELCAAYGAIANDGEYIKPVLYTKVLDHDGNVILENNPEPQRVLKSTTSYLLTDMMKSVITAGTGGKAAFKNSKMALAGKTGTTTETKDLMFAGYTPYYVASIWMGFDQPDTISQDEGFHLRLWSDIMEKVHADLPVKDFELPEGVVTATVCRDSGKLPVAGLCDTDIRGNRTITDLYIIGTQPIESCDMHVTVDIDSVSYKRFGASCPDGNKETLTGVLNYDPGAVLSPDSAWSIPESIFSSPECDDHFGGGVYDGPIIPAEDVISDDDMGPVMPPDYDSPVQIMPVGPGVFTTSTQEPEMPEEPIIENDTRQTAPPITPMPAALTPEPTEQPEPTMNNTIESN